MSIKNLEYLKNIEITKETELDYAINHILNMPDIIDIEDFNFIYERDMKNLVKYRDQFNFFTPRCYAIQYKYKLAIRDNLINLEGTSGVKQWIIRRINYSKNIIKVILSIRKIGR